MSNNIRNNSNSILVDTNTKSKDSKIYCVVCYDKVQLNCIDSENYKWQCPRCRNDYLLFGYGSPDHVKEDDELISSHETNEEGPILFTASDNTDSTSILDREKRSKSDIPIPKYMQNSATTKVKFFREE